MIILGSQSEARFKLLSSCNTEIKVVEANIDEEYDESKSVYENVVNIAKDKADHIIKNYNDVHDINNKILICADTVVLHNSKVLFKPKSYQEAFEMIESYSNTKVEVVTGVYLKYQSEIH